MLKEKKKKEQEREALILCALAGRKKVLADAKRENKRKKKSVDSLLALLMLKGLSAYKLRPAETYVPKSHNLDRQLTGLINHMFVKYPVPDFMYQVCLAKLPQGQRNAGAAQPDPVMLNDMARVQDKNDLARAQDTYRCWFITLAQGDSFNKLVKGLMTSREAVTFLPAPAGRKAHENVWWARMKVAELPEALIGALIDRVFTNYVPDDPEGRFAEVIQFYACEHQALSKNSLDEVTNFIAYKLRNDRQFRMKGRTASSAVKLSDEWHLLMQRAKLGRHIQWDGLRIADWVHEDKAEVWEVVELRDNKDLVNEGRKQKHCVYSYVHRCTVGQSFIFSLRAYRKAAAYYDEDGKLILDRTFETRRVTVEVSPSRSLVQVRGPLNRATTVEEQAVLRRWIGEKGITQPIRT